MWYVCYQHTPPLDAPNCENQINSSEFGIEKFNAPNKPITRLWPLSSIDIPMNLSELCTTIFLHFTIGFLSLISIYWVFSVHSCFWWKKCFIYQFHGLHSIYRTLHFFGFIHRNNFMLFILRIIRNPCRDWMIWAFSVFSFFIRSILITTFSLKSVHFFRRFTPVIFYLSSKLFYSLVCERTYQPQKW